MPVFLKLSFKTDDIVGIEFRLKAILKRMYPVAKSASLYQTKFSLRQSNTDKFPPYITFNCVYQFICTFQSTYTERTERVVSVLISEDIPQSLD